MFEQSVVEARGIAARPWTLAASLTMQTALVSVAIVFPLVHPEMLQKVSVYIPVVGPPRAYHPPAPQRTEVSRTPVTRRTIAMTGLTAPTSVPSRVAQIVDPPPEVLGTASGPGEGVPGGMPWVGDVSPVIAKIANERHEAAQPPAAVVVKPPQPPAPTQQVKRGGEVQAALLVFGPKPAYPPLAKQARIQGTVHLAAVIGADGAVLDLRARDGHPLLVGAAIDAVKRWVYKPTKLNGEPVEVVTEITVTFTLQ